MDLANFQVRCFGFRTQETEVFRFYQCLVWSAGFLQFSLWFSVFVNNFFIQFICWFFWFSVPSQGSPSTPCSRSKIVIPRDHLYQAEPYIAILSFRGMDDKLSLLSSCYFGIVTAAKQTIKSPGYYQGKRLSSNITRLVDLRLHGPSCYSSMPCRRRSNIVFTGSVRVE